MTEFQSHMTHKEIILLSAFLASADVYVEFGCGGSTLLAAKLVAKRVLTVDSDRAWLSKVGDACAEAETSLRPELCFVDIGPTRLWGHPDDEGRRSDWPKYHEHIWSVAGVSAADLYMIDGRFRVASFMQVILNGPPDAIILIHDYSCRPHYHLIEPFARELCRMDELAAFQPKNSFSRGKAESLLSRHRFDTR